MTREYLDMEGVLASEIWIAFAERTGVPNLGRRACEQVFPFAKADDLQRNVV